jgi:SOS-response transcriptional repressor LexA
MNAEVRPSKKQRELLSFIDGFIKQHGYGPSYREIMNGLAYKSVSTVATHVDNLITKGHLRKRDYSARSLEVVTKPDAEFKDTTKVTAAKSKWLVDEITKRFDAVEADAKLRKTELDNLYVLVGALHVLGLTEAAMAFKRRLAALVK